MIIYLAFFKPPQNPLKISCGTLRSPTGEEDKQFLESSPVPIRHLYNMDEVFGPSAWTGSAKLEVTYTVLETNDDGISRISCFALLDILTRHWKYVLHREEYDRRYTFKLGEERPKRSKVPTYSFTPSLINNLKKGMNLLARQRRFAISLERWYSSCTRNDPLDTVLDCCSALEAAISLPNELRLRIAFSVYHTMQTNKKKAFALAYEMYGVRNSFIHGEKVPKVSRKQQQNYIKMVADILHRFVVLGKIPNVESINRMILNDYRDCSSNTEFF